MNTTKKAVILTICGGISGFLCFVGIGVPFAIVCAILMVRMFVKYKSEVWFEESENDGRFSIWTLMIAIGLFDIAMSILTIGLMTGLIDE